VQAANPFGQSASRKFETLERTTSCHCFLYLFLWV